MWILAYSTDNQHRTCLQTEETSDDSPRERKREENRTIEEQEREQQNNKRILQTVDSGTSSPIKLILYIFMEAKA